MIKKAFLSAILGLTVLILRAQPQYDTTILYVDYTPVPVVIDGLDNDSCWNNARWHNIDKVWIPYGATMQEGDFEGYYKAAWDSNYLYLLVKVIDDSLADYYTDPLSNWWNDDCVEIFLDEDRSKGYHECNYNAFAYHVSIFYDAIDMSTTCAGINLRNNLIVKMDTIAPHTYLWEFAIKVYNKNFNPQNPEQSRVKLKPGKTMGFAVAYCDDDGNPNHERENFIGSIFMPAAHYNDNYKTADYLGQMVLVDTKNLWDGEEPSGIAETIVQQAFFTYDAATNILVLNNNIGEDAILKVVGMDGRVVYRNKIQKGKNIVHLPLSLSGSYLVLLTNGYTTLNGKFVK